MVRKIGLLVLVFIAGLLVACGQDEVVEEVVMVTETAVSPTAISPTTTPTQTPAATATTLPTETPSTTPTATTIPTLTPLPTFAPEELETAVADLLANPMNCDIPCWWGAIPGTTTLSDIKHSKSPYNFDIYEYEENGEFVHLRYGIGYIEETNGFEVKVAYNFSKGLLTGVTTYSPPIAEQLAKFGQPDEVWLRIGDFEGLLVRLNLVYLQKGMAVGYVVDGNAQDEKAIACFADEEIGRLRLLTPNTATSYKDFSPIFEKDRRYLPLEEATNLTVAEFMEQFSDPTQPQCIETPTELWD